ncbi:MAG: M20/M25/M40 family metallo-hydrolase [Proteobacteria bacterium]|nr:M20/M25/M40 family metallo-hydrolase [Pseudomonadota bacterium]
MSQSDRARAALAAVDERYLLDIERAMLRIPSPVFEEHAIADYLAGRMADLGLEVEMMEVAHPTENKTTRQPIGRLRGRGGGPTLMLNGHTDPAFMMSGWSVDPFGAKFEDGWIWGAGAHDDKGGVAAAMAAIEAVVRARVPLRGDVLMCAVAAHKAGGVGTRALVARGIRADCCLNMEHSANTIATTVTGSVRIAIATRNSGLFFRYSPEAKAAYFNAIEQQAELIRRFGPSLEPARPGGWLTFAPHPDLPGFPMHRFDRIHKEHYLRECRMLMQVRTVPGQTLVGVREDVMRVIAAARAERPNLEAEVTIPAGGPGDTFYAEPSEIPRSHPLVEALIAGQRLASGREPEVGGALRVGNYGDGNILAAAGIPSVQYGPGDIRIYPEWPAPDERVRLSDLTEAARAIAYAIAEVCG